MAHEVPGFVSDGWRPTQGDPFTRFAESGRELPPDLEAEHRAVQLQPGDVLGDRFEILDMIGFGGIGAVYKVKDRTTNLVQALKVMLPSLLPSETACERFVAEIAIAQQLAHEGVVRVYDLHEDKERGVQFFTMEYVEGATLDQLPQQRHEGRLPAREAVHIAQQLCDVLEYAHQYTAHRDLKPQNVIIRQDGSIKVLDFGLAKLMSPTRLTKSSTALGTLEYQAPEQSVHMQETDQRADLYSVGVMLYQLLTGEIPVGRFPEPSAVAPEVNNALDEVVLTCLEPDPDKRFQNAAALHAALDAAMATMPEPPEIPAADLPPAASLEAQLVATEGNRRPLSRRTVLALVIALAALVALAGIFVAFVQSP